MGYVYYSIIFAEVQAILRSRRGRCTFGSQKYQKRGGSDSPAPLKRPRRGVKKQNLVLNNKDGIVSRNYLFLCRRPKRKTYFLAD